MKQIFYSFLIMFILITVPNTIWGQRTISGTITDAETGDPLIGANITGQGMSIGAITDIDGKYSIDIPAALKELEFSYTGYAVQTIALGTSNILDVQMTAGALLDEVIVIGYGTVKREDATGAITTIKSDQFNKGAINSPQQLLGGKVAGVQVTSNSGAPGEGSTIRIRGGASLSASNDPLIVVDGVIVGERGVAGSRNGLNFINPNDIETFTVLKDASATAIYGSRASNGVILITTKKGNLNTKLSVVYNADFSFSEKISNIDVFDADEFRTLISEQNPGADTLLGNANTDWQKEIYQQAFGHNHNLTFSGGIAEFLPFRLSLGYTDRAGILKTDEFKRTTASLNLSPKFFDNRLQFNLNTKVMNNNNFFANRGAIGSAIAFDPTQPIFADNEFGGYFTFINEAGFPNGLAPTNPLALLELQEDQSTVNRLVISGNVDYRFHFLPELRANLNLSYDRSKGEGTKNVPSFASFAFDSQTGGGVKDSYEQTLDNKLLEFYLNYTKEFGDIKFDATVGYSWQTFFNEQNDVRSDLAGSEGIFQEFNNASDLALLSYFGRVNLGFHNKLLLTATLRRDASSRFSKDTRWGNFPAVALAYKLINNKTGPFESLKLRLGYGNTGQEQIGDRYAYLGTYTGGATTAAYQIGNDFVTTLRPNEYNESIKWEETATYNVGVDYGLFNNRVNGSLEFYLRKTKDLLNFINLPAGSNLSNQGEVNVGNLENKGVEFSINVIPIQKNDLEWSVNFNATHNQNEITKLTISEDPNYIGVLNGGIAGGVGNTVRIHSVGHSIESFYVFEQVYDETGRPIEGLYVDQNSDGRINELDRRQLKNPAPDFFFGLSSNLNYKKLVFSFAGRANIGNHVYNNLQSDHSAYARLIHPTGYALNSVTSIQEVGFENQQYLTDHFVQDGSFFRLDYVSLAYNFGKIIQEKVGLSVSATLQNPILITNYSGIDPEIQGGIDNNIYPRTRTLVLGVNAQF